MRECRGWIRPIGILAEYRSVIGWGCPCVLLPGNTSAVELHPVTLFYLEEKEDGNRDKRTRRQPGWG